MCQCAGAIPFLALSPPVAAALPLLPVDLVLNAGTLQACLVSVLRIRARASSCEPVLCRRRL